MSKHTIGCLPVVHRKGALAGMLTDRDVALSAYLFGEALWRLRVDECMHIPVHTCSAGDDIRVAAQLMHQHRVHRLPVVDEAYRPIGLLSLDDLAHAARQPVLDPTPGLPTDELSALYDVTSGRSKQRRPVE